MPDGHTMIHIFNFKFNVKRINLPQSVIKIFNDSCFISCFIYIFKLFNFKYKKYIFWFKVKISYLAILFLWLIKYIFNNRPYNLKKSKDNFVILRFVIVAIIIEIIINVYFVNILNIWVPRNPQNFHQIWHSSKSIYLNQSINQW